MKMNTQMLNLGCSPEGYTTCTLTFPEVGTYILDDIQIWCQPMDNYESNAEKLREEALENVKTGWRSLEGDIFVSTDKMLCFSIPYDLGWSAYVDGQEVELYCANTTFMAIELEAGEHHIELRYWPQGMTAGIALSIVGMIGFAGLVFFERKNS